MSKQQEQTTSTDPVWVDHPKIGRVVMRGNTDLLADPAVAVIGSRTATAYGQHMASELAADLATGGEYVVVSDGGFGIGESVMRGALRAVRGNALARLVVVLSASPDPLLLRVFYGEVLAKGGLIISVAPPDCVPTRSLARKRNKAIADMSSGVVVVEANTRSQALDVAHHSKGLLMAVPGPVTSGLSEGTHGLIRSGEAALVTCAADVVESMREVCHVG